MRHALAQMRMITLGLALVFAGCASVNEPGVFTVVLLPDTQNYAEKYPETYVAQTEWIRDRRDADNIRFVVHLGDIVQNAMVDDEWKNADYAHRVLDGVVPYSVTPGNHDLDLANKELTRGTTMYDKYFGPERFENEPWYGGHMEGSNANNYCTFEASGMKFMVVSLEWAPRDATIQWAAEVIAAHQDHRVIVATHYYMRTEGRADNTSLDGYNGEGLWNKLIRKHTNVFMVVCGHVGGVFRQVSKNDAGGEVHEILCDYQSLPNGGDGWLQALRFVPAKNEIYVDAYSPLLDKTNRQDPHSYKLNYAMGGGSAR